MIIIEIPINSETIKINVDDARQAVSFIKRLYRNDNKVTFSAPKITSLSNRKNKKSVEKTVKNIFDTLKNSQHNLDGDTGSSQAQKGGK